MFTLLHGIWLAGVVWVAVMQPGPFKSETCPAAIAAAAAKRLELKFQRRKTPQFITITRSKQTVQNVIRSGLRTQLRGRFKSQAHTGEPAGPVPRQHEWRTGASRRAWSLRVLVSIVLSLFVSLHPLLVSSFLSLSLSPFRPVKRTRIMRIIRRSTPRGVLGIWD